MLSWDTTNRLIREKRTNPLLIGLVIEELEAEIERLQDQREERPLSDIEEELLRGFLVKRMLLIKKLRSYFRLQDYDDDQNIERVVREYCGNGPRISFCCGKSARRHRLENDK